MVAPATVRPATRPAIPDVDLEAGRAEVPTGSDAGRGASWWGPAAVAAGVLALAASRPLADNSFLTHLATGRVLLERGWPDANPFLATAPADFPVPSWWWSGVVAVVERVAGHGGIRLLTVVLAGLLGLLVVRLAAGRRGLVAAVLPAGVAVLTLLPFVTPRPHLAGFLLLAVALVVRGEDRPAWWMVPVTATWVNVHGTWAYGIAVLGLLALADAVDLRGAARRASVRRDARLLGAAALGVAVGGLLYPERFRLVVLPLEQLGGGAAREVIQAYNEWRPVGVGSPVFWTVALLAVAAVGGSLWRRRFGAAVVALVLCGLGLSAQRLVPVAAVSLVPLAATALDGVGTLPSPRGRTARAAGAVGVALCTVGVLGALRAPHLDLGRFPVAAVDRLEDRGLVATPEVTLVHQDYVGNYLEWRYGTAAHAYTDDRPDLDTALGYLDLVWARPAWERTLERVGADVVLWDDDQRLTRLLADSPDWVRAERVDGFSVWCRRDFSGCR